jgi:hypothetical protein
MVRSYSYHDVDTMPQAAVLRVVVSNEPRAVAGPAVTRASAAPCPWLHEKIPQLGEENRHLMRRSRKSASSVADERGGRLLLRRRPRGDDWELTLDPPVNAVLPVSRSALWAAFGEA